MNSLPEQTMNINNYDGRVQRLDAIIKNIDKMSSDLKKMGEETQLLLCDLILKFCHPEKRDAPQNYENDNEFEGLENYN
ncbi:putative uncharacterized protein C5orf58 homolog [Ambystoma mexicanum]|uniref:putative uncharacterized protein C5orf58 homolog n=1 Tax=Ambystoma mexicanum TaxID=8296 RepID=UPI0037E76FEC